MKRSGESSGRGGEGGEAAGGKVGWSGGGERVIRSVGGGSLGLREAWDFIFFSIHVKGGEGMVTSHLRRRWRGSENVVEGARRVWRE